MKKILHNSYYTFSPSTSSIDFINDHSFQFEFNKLYAIINTTAGRLIYSAAGHPSLLAGTYTSPTLYLEFDTTSMGSGDILQIIYEGSSTPISDSEENPIFSTLDLNSEKFGLDINLLNSSFGGEVGKTLPYPHQYKALAIGINNGGTLQSPAIDPVTNNLIVDITQNGPIPITAPSGISVYQATTPWQFTPQNSSGTPFDFGAGGTTLATQRVILATDQTALATASGMQSFIDVSGTFTTSNTSGGFGVGIYRANSFQLRVTAASGGSPTFDYSIEESFDGTTWFSTYHFPRITTSGEVHRTPVIRFIGQYFRLIRTIGGTTPSFTMSLYRTSVGQEGGYARNFYDRTLSPNTLLSVTPSYFVEGCSSLRMSVTMNGTGSVMPALTFQGSDDGIYWFSLSSPLTAVISSTVVTAATANIPCRYARAMVTSAGTGSGLVYVNIKGQ